MRHFLAFFLMATIAHAQAPDARARRIENIKTLALSGKIASVAVMGYGLFEYLTPVQIDPELRTLQRRIRAVREDIQNLKAGDEGNRERLAKRLRDSQDLFERQMRLMNLNPHSEIDQAFVDRLRANTDANLRENARIRRRAQLTMGAGFVIWVGAELMIAFAPSLADLTLLPIKSASAQAYLAAQGLDPELVVAQALNNLADEADLLESTN